MKKILLGSLLLVVVIIFALPVIRSTEREPLTNKVRQNLADEFMTTPIGTTHYEVSGPELGEPVLLVHGFASPYYVWNKTAPVLAAAGYRVIRFDAMGRGYSGRPKAVYDREFLARQITELLDSLGINRPINIVGYSMGGVVTAEFVTRHPQQVKKVALIAPFTTAKPIGPLGLPVVGDWLAKVVLAPGMPGRQSLNFAEPEKFPEAANQFREQMKYNGFARAIHSSLKTIIAKDHLDKYQQLGELKKPTLLLWGESDAVLPFSENPPLRGVLGDHVFLPLPNTGHAPALERPDEVNAALLDWLRG